MMGDVISMNQSRTAMKQFLEAVGGNRNGHVRSIMTSTPRKTMGIEGGESLFGEDSRPKECKRSAKA